eukprot:IDg5172t1
MESLRREFIGSIPTSGIILQYSIEQRESTRFRSKPASVLAEGVPLKFNGMILHKNGDRLTVKAAVADRQLLATIRVKPVDRDFYVAQRARGAYIAAVCIPDLAFRFASAAQHTHADESHARALNKLIEKCISTRDFCLYYIRLDSDTLTMGVFIDASFANNADFSSQLGFITLLMDRHARVNIVHYSSVKSMRATRSALAAELYAMVFGLDQNFVIHKATEDFLRRSVPLHMNTDSLSLFESLTTLNNTSEK